MRWDERAASWKTGTRLTSGRDGAPGHMTVGTARSSLLHRASRSLNDGALGQPSHGDCCGNTHVWQVLWETGKRVA